MSPLSTTTWSVEQSNLLQKLSEKDWQTLQTHSTTLSLEKGECLFPNEAETACVYLITSGFGKLLTLNAEGKQFTITILKQGDLLGNLLTAATTTAEEPDEFLEALATCTFLRIKNPVFTSVIEGNPKLYLSVLQQLQGKTVLLQRKLSSLLFKDVHARIAQLFLEMVFEHGHECPYAFGLQRDLCLKHHEIAELVGASRPVTSLALGDFQKADLIHKHNGFICLQSLENLKHVAQHGAKALQEIKTLFISQKLLAS